MESKIDEGYPKIRVENSKLDVFKKNSQTSFSKLEGFSGSQSSIKNWLLNLGTEKVVNEYLFNESEVISVVFIIESRGQNGYFEKLEILVSDNDEGGFPKFLMFIIVFVLLMIMAVIFGFIRN